MQRTQTSHKKQGHPYTTFVKSHGMSSTFDCHMGTSCQILHVICKRMSQSRTVDISIWCNIPDITICGSRISPAISVYGDITCFVGDITSVWPSRWMVKPVFRHSFAPARWILKKECFDIWNRSGTLDYLRNAVEIIALSSSVQKLIKKQCT